MVTESASSGGRRQSDRQFRQYRTLLVDDDPDILYLIQLFLDQAEDFQMVGVATHGGQAVALARRLKPDLVLLDVLMPEMDGFEAYPLIREAVPEAKIVFLTQLGEADMDAIAAGRKVTTVPVADGVLMKMDLGSLVNRLRETLRA